MLNLNFSMSFLIPFIIRRVVQRVDGSRGDSVDYDGQRINKKVSLKHVSSCLFTVYIMGYSTYYTQNIQSTGKSLHLSDIPKLF